MTTLTKTFVWQKENSKIYNSLGVVVYYNIISSNTPVRQCQSCALSLKVKCGTMCLKIC